MDPGPHLEVLRVYSWLYAMKLFQGVWGHLGCQGLILDDTHANQAPHLFSTLEHLVDNLYILRLS